MSPHSKDFRIYPQPLAAQSAWLLSAEGSRCGVTVGWSHSITEGFGRDLRAQSSSNLTLNASRMGHPQLVWAASE